MTIAAAAAPGFVQRWRALGTVCLAHMVHDGYTDFLYVLLPIWQEQLGLSLTEVGAMRTVFSGSMAVFQTPAGMLGEKRGERGLLAAGTLLIAVAVSLYAYAGSAPALFALLALGGLGASVQHPLASAVVSKAYAGRRLRAVLGTYNFAGDLGKVAIPGIGAILIGAFGWPTATQAVGVIGIGVAALVLFGLPRDGAGSAAAKERKGGRLSLSEGRRRRAFTALCAIGTVDSATRTGFLTFLPFLLTAKGADPALIGLALSLVFAGGAAGKFACGFLADWLGVLRTVILTEAATALGILALLGLPLGGCLVLIPLIGVALNGTSSVLYGSVPDLAPPGREARAFGLFYTVGIGAGAVSPTVYGAVGDAIGVAHSMVLIAAVVLLTLPITLALRGIFVGDDA